MANRLKRVLPKLISLLQGAFILCQDIVDNVLVAHKILNSFAKIPNKQALILDGEKACDSLECKFITNALLTWDFRRHGQVNYRMCYYYKPSVLVSGIRREPFRPKRDIRHGDPISPCFIICAEYHGRCINFMANVPKTCIDIKIAKKGPIISCLCCWWLLIFCKTNMGATWHGKDI